MDWKLVIDTRQVKQIFFDLQSAYDWVYKHTSYPFFAWKDKMYMATSIGPHETEYILSKGRIIIPNDVIHKITSALNTGRLRCIIGKRRWNGYTVVINEQPNRKDSIQVDIYDKNEKMIGCVYMSKPKKNDYE